jgi:hypothetical protein
VHLTTRTGRHHAHLKIGHIISDANHQREPLRNRCQLLGRLRGAQLPAAEGLNARADAVERIPELVT